MSFSQRELEQTTLQTSSVSSSAKAEGGRFGDDDEVLEKHCRLGPADEAKMAKHPLTKAVVAFLRAHKANECPAIIVSLSGGVDSMVIMEILAHLRRTSPTKYPFKLVAIHIDYGNRKESAHEADFLRRWCDAMDIELHIRAITEAKRGASDRDEYEKLTRQIRFGLYQQIQAATGAPAVCFGHHEGDVRENGELSCSLFEFV